MEKINKDEIVLDEDASELMKADDGRSEMGLNDFTNRWIKNPKVGETVEFTMAKIYRMTKNLEAVDPLTKQKFSTKLSGVDYGVEIETDDGSKFGVRNWSTYGQIKALCKLVGEIKGLKLKITHVNDGMKRENKDKDVELYRVHAFINGSWKYIDKKGVVCEEEK